jgi:hypothetical protein
MKKCASALMLDNREASRIRIKMIVAANKQVDSSKREDIKISRIKTRSAIVVIYNYSIKREDRKTRCIKTRRAIVVV